MSDFDSMVDDSQVAIPTAPTAPAAPQAVSPGDFDSMADDSEKYGTAKQIAKTVGEGALQSTIGPLAPLLETTLGAKPSDILARQHENPIAHGVGEGLGLLGGAATGTGEAALMETAGKGAAEALGLGAPTTYAAKVGSSAVRQAAEMAVMQGSDETAKMVLSDPDTSAESAIANIGMAAALGGAGGAFVTGAISPLWKATVGNRAEQFLNTLQSKLGGVEGKANESAGLEVATGLKIPNELKPKIDGDPMAGSIDSALSQTDTSIAGRKYQDIRDQFHTDIGNKMVETLGHEPGYSVPDIDKYSVGQKIADDLHSELKETMRPISDSYEKINKEFKDTPISGINQRQIADDIAQKSIDNGWHKAESDAQINLMERVLKKLPEQQTAEDLKLFITNLRDNHPFGSDTYQAARDMAKTLQEAQGRAVTEGIVAKGGDTAAAAQKLQEYQALKGQYAGFMNKLDDLNQHLHVGKYDGPKSFLTALKDLSNTNGEGVLSRLSGINKAQALSALGETSPKALAQVRQYHVDSLLRGATDAEGEIIPGKLIKKFGELSPQVKDLMVSPEQSSRMQALGQVLEKLKDPSHNWSNTARTTDKLMHGAPTAISMLAAVMGHGGEAILAHMGQLGFKEGRDALKLGMMRFLGADQPIKSEAFKSMVEMLHNTVKGQAMIVRGTQDVLKTGAQVLTSKEMPNTADREKLDKIVTRAQSNPETMINLTSNSKTGHYLPEHQVALTKTACQSIQYLQNLKPMPYQPSPLDRAIEPDPAKVARYNRALDICQQPMVVLQHVKDGTLQASDIKDISSMYPALYKNMSQRLTNELMNVKNEGNLVPYKTKIGMSLFLGQPMDTSMQPTSILNAQPKPTQQPNQGSGQPKMGKRGTSTLGKANKSYMTPNQGAESDRSNRD